MKVFYSVFVFLSILFSISTLWDHGIIIKSNKKTFPAMKPLPMGDNGPLDFQKMETETKYYPWG